MAANAPPGIRPGRPSWLKSVLRHITPDNISRDDLVGLMNDALQVPGLSNAWTQPIKGRIDMLTTGIRTPVGLKIQGADLAVIEEIGLQIESLLAPIEGTRGVFAERTGGGYFVDVEWKREELARYGLHRRRSAGGPGRGPRRRERRRRPSKAGSATPSTSATCATSGATSRPSEGSSSRSATAGARSRSRSSRPSRQTTGPAMIRDEDGLLTGYVYVDVAGRDPEKLHPTTRTGSSERRSPCRRATRSVGAASSKPCPRVRETAEAGHSDHALPHPHPALSEHEVLGQNLHRPVGRPVLRRRGALAPLFSRLQS